MVGLGGRGRGGRRVARRKEPQASDGEGERMYCEESDDVMTFVHSFGGRSEDDGKGKCSTG